MSSSGQDNLRPRKIKFNVEDSSDGEEEKVVEE